MGLLIGKAHNPGQDQCRGSTWQCWLCLQDGITAAWADLLRIISEKLSGPEGRGEDALALGDPLPRGLPVVGCPRTRAESLLAKSKSTPLTLPFVSGLIIAQHFLETPN